MSKRLIVGMLAAAALVVVGAAAAAAPENTAPPAITGAAREGTTLTASHGTWSNNPTSYTYIWQRCTSDAAGCTTIPGTTKSTYTLAAADVGRTVRVLVTAVNADGRDTVPSAVTAIVSSKNAPKNTARPVISGDATVGGELTVSNGSWTPAPASYGYQWQRCDTDGSNCVNVPGATGQTYGVRSVDVGNIMRVIVVARTQAGDRGYEVSEFSDLIETDQPPVQANKPPTIRFIGLTRVGVRTYARFRICDDGYGKITIVQRDLKARTPGYTRKFAVRIAASCGVFSRSWVPAKRFRTSGRYVVRLQAIDSTRHLSKPVTRSLYRR
jgi:hypothetical protein